MTSLEKAPEGEVALLSYANGHYEAEGIADIVSHLIKNEKVPSNEVLILLRSDYRGAFSHPIKLALDKRGITYSDADYVKNTLAHVDNRRMMQILRLIVDREDAIAWLSLFAITPQIGASFNGYIYTKAKAANSSFAQALFEEYDNGFLGAPRSGKAAKKLMDEILPVLDASNDDVKPWGVWISSLDWAPNIAPMTPDMHAILNEVDKISEPSIDLGRYLGSIRPLGQDIYSAKSAGVRIMSMLSAKGLTVEATIVAGTENGNMPRNDNELDEERRLLYVAMTRSTKYLYCTWAEKRGNATGHSGGSAPSEVRNYSEFLEGGPVANQKGSTYIKARWPHAGSNPRP